MNIIGKTAMTTAATTNRSLGSILIIRRPAFGTDRVADRLAVVRSSIKIAEIRESTAGKSGAATVRAQDLLDCPSPQ
jgi:hypothetical protein